MKAKSWILIKELEIIVPSFTGVQFSISESGGDLLLSHKDLDKNYRLVIGKYILNESDNTETFTTLENTHIYKFVKVKNHKFNKDTLIIDLIIDKNKFNLNYFEVALINDSNDSYLKVIDNLMSAYKNNSYLGLYSLNESPRYFYDFESKEYQKENFTEIKKEEI